MVIASVKSPARLYWIALLCAGVAAVSGCTNPTQQNAAPKSEEQVLDADPLEPLNRFIFGFNRTVDGLILKPVTMIYRGVVPEKGREMVSNFMENLYTPVVFANSVLQGDAQNSFKSFWRFAINTSVGVGGLFDPASEVGIKNRPADLGQTFAMYGAQPGPYFVLPIIGPSNIRDAFGRVGDMFLNPVNYLDQGPGLSIAVWSATAVDQRSTHMKLIDGIYESSLDPYATFRSGFTQKRASDIKHAKEERAKSLEQSFGK